MIQFENYYAIFLIPFLVLLTILLHSWGYKNVYLKAFRFIHPFTRVIKTRTKKDKRLATLTVKALIVSLLSLSLAQPYTIEKVYKTIDTEAELEDILKVAKPAVVIAIDVSGSMGGSIPGGKKIEVAKKVVSNFIEKLPGNFDAGFIAFSHKIVANVPVTSDHKLLLDVVKRLNASGGTMYTYPLRSMLSMLKPYRFFNITVFAIFVTDGLPADPEYRDILNEYSNLEIPVYTVYIGSGNNRGVAETKYIAEKTGGLQFTAETANDLYEAFRKFSRVAEEIHVKMKMRIKFVKEEEVKKPLSQYTTAIALVLTLLLFFKRYLYSRVTF